MISVNIIIDNPEWKKKKFKIINYIKKNIKHLSKKPILKKKHSFSILLTDNKNMKSLNKKFRKKNKSTDVLSFPFYEKKKLIKKIKKEKEIYIGDVIVNLNKIKNKNNKRLFLSEFNKLWIHGLVHLFGHQHKRDKDFYKMDKLEKKYIKSIS